VTSDLFADVDAYVTERLIGPDDALDAALADSERAGLPAIAVSAPQGRFLNLLSVAIGARRILEIGTLGGYSTIWMARALPAGGRLITLELQENHARVARANLERAGLSDRVEIRVGPALDSLARLHDEAQGEPQSEPHGEAGTTDPFDLTFIDADKENIPAYFDWAVKLSRPGAVIVTDNVVRNGALVDPRSDDPRVAGVRAFHDMLTGRADVSATTIQTVGAKGYDGFNVAIVNG
jgi:predicted O-methyltransferase YrrM